MIFTVWIAGAFLLGLFVSRAGLPPLIGFLLAGFTFRAFGVESDEMLRLFGEFGVMILLFTVGLKLRLRSLFKAEVLWPAVLHFGITASGSGILIHEFTGLSLAASLTLGAGFAFSSTVIAAKMLEVRKELRAFHGRVAIGVLIVQDLLAVIILALVGDHSPSPWAIGVLGVFLARPLFIAVLDRIGHGDLLVIYGVVLALAVGGYGFEIVGLNPELGALLIGGLIGEHRKAKELGDVLWGVKEFLLVGFFLNIGMTALPTPEMLLYAAGLLLLLSLKAMLFFWLLLGFGLRARTAFMSTLSLVSYSEFGLILVQGAVSSGLLATEWLVITALTVALSFVVVAPLHRYAQQIYERFGQQLERFERQERSHPDDQPVSLGDAEIIIVGMGRIGTSAYDHLRELGEAVVGLENDPGKLARHEATDRRVLFADAEDPGFWHRLDLRKVRAVMLALPDVEAKIIAAEQLRHRGFRGLITATHIYQDEVSRIRQAGCDATYNNFSEAGVGFASDTYGQLRGQASETNPGS